MCLRIFIFLLVLVVGLGCQKRKASPVSTSIPDAVEMQGAVHEDPNGLSPALYFIPILNAMKTDCADADLKPIKNIQGQIIVHVCDSDYKLCLKHGTCLVSEKRGMRIINFTTRRGKIPLFSDKIKKECPYGLGMKDICLDPYYTIAGDLNFYKLGDVIYIPSARGVLLPNGDVHDGYFVIRDSGSNLKSDKRFDFFTGFDRDDDISNTFKKLGLDDKANRFKYEKVSDQIAKKVRTKRNYPKLNKKQISEANATLKKAMTK